MTLYLLDTPAFIWWIGKSYLLPPLAKETIATSGNEIAVSLVSAWEIAIKVGLGKLRDVGNFQAVADHETFTIQPIELDHIDKMKSLPLHHRDPFDRMLIAQSLAENATLISNETVFDAYGVRRLWD